MAQLIQLLKLILGKCTITLLYLFRPFTSSLPTMAIGRLVLGGESFDLFVLKSAYIS